MKVILMAGGEGTRLRPLTMHTPKPLIPICGKPVMQHMIEKLKEHGLTDIIVTLHYLADEIINYFEDGSEFGVSISYSVEEEPLGTAGSIKKIQSRLDETFLIVSGDALADFDFTDIIRRHKLSGAMASIVLCKVENPLEYGVTITDEDSNIIKFIEKPTWGEVFSDTVNTGIYCLEPEILNFMEEGRVYDFSNDIFSKMLQNKIPIHGCISDGYWCDIGNINQYVQATHDLLSGHVDTTLDGKEIKENIRVGEHCEIDPSAQLQAPIILGKNCKVEAGAVIRGYSVIGDNCIISSGAVIERSILLSNIYVGKFSQVRGSIICRGVTIKENVTTHDGSIVGDKCFIGAQSQINSNIKIWPEKNIAPASVVSMSLIWGGRWQGTFFGTNGITGLANIEITPEFALKLGSSFASIFERGVVINTSRDDNKVSRMINRALICGLSSAGVTTSDMRVAPISVARHAVKNSPAKAAVHVRIAPRNPHSILIELFDENGITINKKTERKIENIFSREDFRRSSFGEIGDIAFPTRFIENYVTSFLSALNTELISKQAFKVVLDYGYSSSSTILPMILSKLRCDAISINAFIDSDREIRYNKKNQVSQLSKVVTTLGADMGILFDSDAESIFLTDETGNKISAGRLLTLMAFLIFKSDPTAEIAVPLNAPAYIEKLAWEAGAKVYRTKIGSQDLMEASASNNKIAFAGNCRGEFIFPYFNSGFDGLFAFAKLMELMASTGYTLAGAAENIPEIYQFSDVVECSFADKGAIMRKLYQYYRGNPTETKDGLKVYFKRSWILVFPDKLEPSIHVRAEADTQAEASELLSEAKIIIEACKGNCTPVKNSEEDASFRKRFFFWTLGFYTGYSATNQEEFLDCLNKVEIDSIKYHLKHGDFALLLKHFKSGTAVSAAAMEKMCLLSDERLRRSVITLFK